MTFKSKKIQSPCKDICITRDGLCIGCYRSLEEMAGWPSYTEKQKEEVLENIKKRRPSQDYYGGPA